MSKILYFCQRVDKNTEMTGGAWSAIQILVNLESYMPFVLVNRHDVFTDKLDSLKIPFAVIEAEYVARNFKKSRVLKKVWTILGLLRQNAMIWPKIREVDPDVVLCDETAAIGIFLGTKLARKKLIVYVRNGFRGSKLKLVYKIPMQFADAIVAISKGLGDFIIEKGGAGIGRKVTQIYNSVNVQEIKVLREMQNREAYKSELGMTADCIAVGMIAFVEPRKRQKEFLSEVVTRFENDRNVYFLLIGGIKDEEYYLECKRIVENSGLSRVAFVNYQKDVFKWYLPIDVVCLASEREGLPRALIEAAAFGIPSVAFRIAGCQEAIIDGETGFLVDSFEEFAERLRYLIDHPELRSRMGRRGEEHVLRNFEARKNTRELEDLCDRLQR
jgi:glycosyltransferase involved in cell wall biosynthesis